MPGVIDWGIASTLTPGTSADAFTRGFRTMMLEIQWGSAETSNNVFSTSYFNTQVSKINGWVADGHKVVLNFGLHHSPGWLRALSDMYFIDETGRSSSTLSGSSNEVANFVFNIAARDLYGQRYVNEVFSRLGTDFYAVRVGGGHFGELNYPDESAWWCYDTNAQTMKVTYGVDPAWLPGETSTNHDKARAFWYFHIDRLSDYLNWQIAAVRTAGYTGPIATLQASDGVRSDPAAPGYTSSKDPETVILTDLDGSNGIEQNEMREGYDHKKMVMSIPGTYAPIVVWPTASQRHTQVPQVAYWADQRRWRKMTENANDGSYEEACTSQRLALTHGIEHIQWIRGEQAYGSTGATESASTMTCGIDALELIVDAGSDPVHVVDDWRTFVTGAPWNAWRSNQWTVSGTNHTVETRTAGGVLTWTDVSGSVARAVARCGWTNNASAAMAALGDCELLARFAFTENTAKARLEFHLRASGNWDTAGLPANSYWLEIATDSATVTLKKSVAGTVSNITTYTSGAGLTTVQQWARFRVVGSDVNVRHWTGARSAEPGTWDLTSAGTAGEVASGVHQIRWNRDAANSGVKTVTFDVLRVVQLV